MELDDGDSCDANRLFQTWLSLSRDPELAPSPVRLIVCGLKASGQRDERGGLSIGPVEVSGHVGISYNILRVHACIVFPITSSNAIARDISCLREVVVDVVEMRCWIVDAIVMASKSVWVEGEVDWHHRIHPSSSPVV